MKTGFYPRPPRGGRRPGSHCYGGMGQFLSTPSARRATFVNHEKHIVFVISIHALREEGDQSCTLNLPCHENFYPRPPRGGRPVNPVLCTSRQNFYPRPPRGGRLVLPCTGGPVQDISIHALREEGDYEAQNQCRPRTDFYPRPPRGGRRQKQRQNLCFQTNYTTFCTNLEEL